MGTRVLVIEDDEAIAALLVDVLTEEGYIPTIRTTPDAALALLRSEGCAAFHLVLSNPFAESQACPYAFVEHLRALTAAPIVICSAAPPTRYADYHTRGYAGFLAEPFDLTDLMALVRALCPAPAPRAGHPEHLMLPTADQHAE